MQSDPWPAEEIKANHWLLVTAFVVDAVYLLPDEAEQKLFRNWRRHVPSNLKPDAIRSAYARSSKDREEAIVEILADLGCPQPKWHLKKVGLIPG